MTTQQQPITAGQIAGSVAARILANKGVVSDGSEYTQGPGFYHLQRMVPKLQSILIAFDYLEYKNLQDAANQVMKRLTPDDRKDIAQAIDKITNPTALKRPPARRNMQPIFWFPNTETLHQEVAQALLTKAGIEKPDDYEITPAVAAALRAIPELDAIVHEYPDSLVQIDAGLIRLVLQQTKDLADEIIEQLTDEHVMAFREQMRQQEE